MALYDMACPACQTVSEVRCAIAERESQKCAACTAVLTPLFSPPTQIVIPRAFGVAYSDLFGTSSEKDYRAANPDLEVVSPSRTAKSDRQRKKAEREKVIAEGKDIERTLIARGQLKKYDVEAGAMPADV